MTIYKVMVFFLLTFNQLMAQKPNEHGLTVISSKKAYKKQCKTNTALKMVAIKKYIPTLQIDLKYKTAQNFLNKKLYPNNFNAFLRLPVAQALNEVQKQLLLQGKSLKIFDAYRPYSVTKAMWEPIKDERYVANPKYGSGHNKGLAVDLTIVELSSKSFTELEMGTNFDSFSDTAHHSFKMLPEKTLQNRLLLKGLMEKHGFRALETEWWHYSWIKSEGFDVLDILDF
jgi:zinc D-Ala-D-Ala dipeptidase